MRMPLLVRSSVAAAPALRTPWAAGPSSRLLHVAARSLSWAPLGAILAGALFLRLYRLDGLVTYYPDTYGQLQGVENLLSAQFPISYYYPPGIALALAPVFAFLPHTLLTMQVAIMAAGMALIVLGYVICLVTTGDRRAALFFAAAVALSAAFVFHSRVALFDVINILLIALTLFLAPFVTRRGLVVLLPYGLLVFVAVTVRYTNVILLPALLLASLELGSRPFSWRLVRDGLRSRATITVGLVVLALYAVYAGTAFDSLVRFTSPQGGGLLDLGQYLPRLGQYLEAGLTGYGGELQWQNGLPAAGVLALAVIGARRLWYVNRGLFVPLVYLLIAWLLVHALYVAFWSRYAMPVFFFVLLLAALGLSTGLEWLNGLPRLWQRVGLTLLLTLAVTFSLGQQLVLDIATVQPQLDEVIRHREDAYEEIRAVLRGLDGPRSVLVSNHALAVDRANPSITTYDLIRHSETFGINEESINTFLTYVRGQQERGKTVYFHHTGFTDAGWTFRRYELGFDAYFSALQGEFSLRELVRSPSATPVQRLYVLEPPARNE
jgi:hypothetical protein